MNKAELFYNETARRTQEQYSSSQHFDTMATAVLGLGGLVLSAMVVTVSHWSNWSIIPASLVMVFFLALAITAITSLWTRVWQFQPQLSHLETNVKSGKYKSETLLIWSSHWMADAVVNNERRLTYKANCLRISYITLAIEVCMLGILVVSVSIITTIY